MPRRSRRREKPMGLDNRHIGRTLHTRSAESHVSRSMVFLLCSSAYTSLVKPLFKRVWCLLAWLTENVQLAITVVCCGAFLLALHLYSFLLSHIDYNLPHRRMLITGMRGTQPLRLFLTFIHGRSWPFPRWGHAWYWWLRNKKATVGRMKKLSLLQTLLWNKNEETRTLHRKGCNITSVHPLIPVYLFFFLTLSTLFW